MSYDWKSFQFTNGSHGTRAQGMCVMEAVAYVAGEDHSDHPECAGGLVTRLAVSINDGCDDDADRNRRLAPALFRLAGSRLDDIDLELERSALAAERVLSDLIDPLTEAIAAQKARAVKLGVKMDQLLGGSFQTYRQNLPSEQRALLDFLETDRAWTKDITVVKTSLVSIPRWSAELISDYPMLYTRYNTFRMTLSSYTVGLVEASMSLGYCLGAVSEEFDDAAHKAYVLDTATKILDDLLSIGEIKEQGIQLEKESKELPLVSIQ